MCKSLQSCFVNFCCPTPHGVGGLKSTLSRIDWTPEGPTPHGVGGLKLHLSLRALPQELSHPARGGWIEMKVSGSVTEYATVPPRTGWVD